MEKQQPWVPAELFSPPQNTDAVSAASWTAEQFLKPQLAGKLPSVQEPHLLLAHFTRLISYQVTCAVLLIK